MTSALSERPLVVDEIHARARGNLEVWIESSRAEGCKREGEQKEPPAPATALTALAQTMHLTGRQ
jgi:hypothetical protein